MFSFLKVLAVIFTIVTLCSAKNILLKDSVVITVKNPVLFSTYTVKSIYTGEYLHFNKTNTGNLTLKFQNKSIPYELSFRKKGYDTHYTIFTPFQDTTILIQWAPKHRGKIFVRSLLLPGWGQYYSDRRTWWWPTTACITTISTLVSGALAVHFNSKAFDAEQKYRTVNLKNLKNRYYLEKKDFRKKNIISEKIFIYSSITLGSLWLLNSFDSIVMAIGPESKVSLTPSQGKITIDF